MEFVSRKLAPMALLVLTALATPAPALADTAAGERKAQLCLLCHKVDAAAAHGPALHGQTREYLYNQIRAYKEKRRADPEMQANVAALSDKDMRDVAAYFASRAPVRRSFEADPQRVARGHRLAGSLGCAACHRDDYGGANEAARLAGLESHYLGAQLAAFGSGKRPHPVVGRTHRIAETDAQDLAEYLAQLK